MSDSHVRHADRVESSCALVARALSEGRRRSVRLVSGERRGFGLSRNRTVVQVPFPAMAPDWTLRSLSCGVALQCAPSKDRIALYPLYELPARQLLALTIVEAAVALGWIESRWPGLRREFSRLVPGMEAIGEALDGAAILDRAQTLARSGRELQWHPLLGQLPLDASAQRGLWASLRRTYGRLPWSSKRPLSQSVHTVPVGGDGGARSSSLPPPSRPDDDDGEIRTDRRSGIPYPEWNVWTGRFLPDHVAVLERRHATRPRQSPSASADLRRWFEQHTHRAIQGGLEDGSDLDVDRYIEHYAVAAADRVAEARVFRDLLPAARDVVTAVLLDGSASLGVHQGRIFQLELACADALSRAMALARERHGLFVFSGNTRHRVEVVCLKDFDEARFIAPGSLGLVTGGYTRLGAPLRHLTRRLSAQPSERRLLIAIGDGLLSDEGYEGRYAWADGAHAVDEATSAGVSVYYIGVGPARVDPLPEVFGPRRSTRIMRVEELPHVLAHVHRELVAA
jgi:hypothetical protein